MYVISNVFFFIYYSTYKATDQYAFKLLDSLVSNNQYATLSQFIPTILNLLLHRMQEQMKETKTPKYCRSFLHSMSIFAAVYGGAVLEQAFDGIEKGLINMIILQVWSVNRANCASADKPEVKLMIVGATRILCETSIAKNPDAFGSLLKSIVALLSAGAGKGGDFNEDFLDEEADAREFDSTYSKLAYAHVPDTDPAAEIPSAAAYFASALSSLSRAAAGQYTGIIATALDEQEKGVLQSVVSQAGVSL
jgi:exportin-2 (importin alpha re-exporter)